MTSELDEFRANLVAAMQVELERHAGAVVAEVDRLRDEGRRGREEIQADLNRRLGELAGTVEQIHAAADERAEQLEQRVTAMQRQFEQRVADSDARQTRRLDDLSASLETMVAESTKPALADVRDGHEALGRRVDGLDANLRAFDEQAARMVTYFNDASEQLQVKHDELSEAVHAEVAARVEELKRLVDENDAAVRRFQTEVGQSVTQKLNDSEDRFNQRLLSAEDRIKEGAGQQIADIDVHVSRVSSNLDESLGVVNDRIAGIDDRFVETDRRIEAVEESVKGVDQDAIEELKEQLSTAAGEAMLVRIEMERLEKGVDEKTDSITVRLTEVEQTLQDQVMDVSTAVQLDRLEEIERALIELDPDQFVRKDDAPTVAAATNGASHGFAPPGSGEETVENPGAYADASSGPDIAAIVAAAEGRTDHADG